MSNTFYWDGNSGSCSYGDKYAVFAEKPVIEGLTYDTCTYDEASNVYSKRVGAEDIALTAEERSAILGFITNAVVNLPYKEAFVKTVPQVLSDTEKDQVAKNVGLRRVHAQGGDDSSGYWIQYEDGEMEIKKYFAIETIINKRQGNLFVSEPFDIVYPVPFVKAICCVLFGNSNNYGISFWVLNGITSTTAVTGVSLAKAESAGVTATKYKISLVAHGTWK